MKLPWKNDSAATAAAVVAVVAATAVAAAAAEQYDDEDDDPEAAVASVIAEHNYIPFSALILYASQSALRGGGRCFYVGNVELFFAARAIICTAMCRCYTGGSIPCQEV